MGQLLLSLLARPQSLRLDAELRVPVLPHIAPVFVPLPRLDGMTEKLNLHLLELAAAERVVSRIDFISERLADLSDSEGQLEASAIDNISEIREDALGGFGTEISLVVLITHCANVSLKHQVELTRFSKLPHLTALRAWRYLA